MPGSPVEEFQWSWGANTTPPVDRRAGTCIAADHSRTSVGRSCAKWTRSWAQQAIPICGDKISKTLHASGAFCPHPSYYGSSCLNSLSLYMLLLQKIHSLSSLTCSSSNMNFIYHDANWAGIMITIYNMRLRQSGSDKGLWGPDTKEVGGLLSLSLDSVHSLRFGSPLAHGQPELRMLRRIPAQSSLLNHWECNSPSPLILACACNQSV